ncbi:MAG: hypothetical protein ACOH2G_05065 [Ewingella sp.]
MTKNQKIRLQFVDAMFTVHGRVSRAQIIEVFGVAMACASRDISAYARLNSQVYFSHQHLSYLCREDFIPVVGLLDFPAVNFLESISIVFAASNLALEENVRPLPRMNNHE